MGVLNASEKMLKAKIVGSLVFSQTNPILSSGSTSHWLSRQGQATSSLVP